MRSIVGSPEAFDRVHNENSPSKYAQQSKSPSRLNGARGRYDENSKGSKQVAKFDDSDLTAYLQ